MSSEFRTLLGSVLDESGTDEAPAEIGVGVLSMAADGVPYGVPPSFGYDGDDHQNHNVWALDIEDRSGRVAGQD